MNIHANEQDFFKAFDFCISQKMSKNLALIFSKKFSTVGKIDASEGFFHYVLHLTKLDEE